MEKKIKRGKHEFRIKRVYDEPSADDGFCFLVDRLWPRGVKKETLHLTGWLKEIAPGSELRKWFNHDPAKWKEFQKRYRAELEAAPENYQPLLAAIKTGDVTLLFSAHDLEHNNAVVLKACLEKRLKNGSIAQC